MKHGYVKRPFSTLHRYPQTGVLPEHWTNDLALKILPVASGELLGFIAFSTTYAPQPSLLPGTSPHKEHMNDNTKLFKINYGKNINRPEV